MGNRIPERKARIMHIGRCDNDFKLLPIKQTQRTANDAPTGTESHAKTAREHANDDATMMQSRQVHTTPTVF